MINFSEMHNIVETAQITKPGTNAIKGYEFLQVYIYGSNSTQQNGGRQEHNPPHFHIIHKDGFNLFNITVDIQTLEIQSVYANKSKDIKIEKFNNSYTWETSSLMNLKKSLLDWLNKTNKAGITNLTSIKLQWDDNNPNLIQTL